MHQPVLMDPQINEGTERGDVRHDTFENHAGLQILGCAGGASGARPPTRSVLLFRLGEPPRSALARSGTFDELLQTVPDQLSQHAYQGLGIPVISDIDRPKLVGSPHDQRLLLDLHVGHFRRAPLGFEAPRNCNHLLYATGHSPTQLGEDDDVAVRFGADPSDAGVGG